MGLAMSLMRTHQARARMASVRKPGPDGPGGKVLGSMPAGLMGASQLAAMLQASLDEDLAALHAVASVERKIAIKRETLVPKYRDYVARLLAAGQRHELLGYYLVWCLDAGIMEEGLRVATWALGHGQSLPVRFRASLPLFVASQALAWGEAEHNAGRTVEPYLAQALALTEPTGEVPDQIRAGFHRLFGLQAEQAGDLALAARELDRALDLGAKVKTAREAVYKRMAKAQAHSAATPDTSTGGDGEA